MSKHNTRPISRTQSRALAFQILYSLEFAQINTIEDLRSAFIRAPRVTISYDKEYLQHDIIADEENQQAAPSLPSIDSLPLQEDDTIKDLPNSTIQPIGFTWELVVGVWTYLSEIDQVIQEYAKNWRLDRLGRIELTILRMALFEMLYRDDIPAKVSIAEALELTNKFADLKAHSFINGLLDAVHKNKAHKEGKNEK